MWALGRASYPTPRQAQMEPPGQQELGEVLSVATSAQEPGCHLTVAPAAATRAAPHPEADTLQSRQTPEAPPHPRGHVWAAGSIPKPCEANLTGCWETTTAQGILSLAWATGKNQHPLNNRFIYFVLSGLLVSRQGFT